MSADIIPWEWPARYDAETMEGTHDVYCYATIHVDEMVLSRVRIFAGFTPTDRGDQFALYIGEMLHMTFGSFTLAMIRAIDLHEAEVLSLSAGRDPLQDHMIDVYCPNCWAPWSSQSIPFPEDGGGTVRFVCHNCGVDVDGPVPSHELKEVGGR